jgi:hypothetical protein
MQVSVIAPCKPLTATRLNGGPLLGLERHRHPRVPQRTEPHSFGGGNVMSVILASLVPLRETTLHFGSAGPFPEHSSDGGDR